MKKRKALSPYKKFAAQGAAEKEAIYRDLDDPEIATKARPLSLAMKKLWKRAKRKPGRPAVGRGAKRVLLSIERGLLDQADAYASRQKLTRSELFSRGVKAV